MDIGINELEKTLDRLDTNFQMIKYSLNHVCSLLKEIVDEMKTSY